MLRLALSNCFNHSSPTAQKTHHVCTERPNCLSYLWHWLPPMQSALGRTWLKHWEKAECLWALQNMVRIITILTCVRKIAKSDYYLRHICLRVFVRPHVSTGLPLDGFSWDLICAFFRKSVKQLQISLKSDKNKEYFTRRLFTFMTISQWTLLWIRNVFDRSCRKKK
jgi:hypothetical protein